MSNLSRRFRETRRRLGLKQGELAQALGVSQGTISRWETGDASPDFSAMMKLAEMAGVDPVHFAMGESDHPFNTSRWGKKVKVVGSVSEDTWSESIELDPSESFEIVMPSLPQWNSASIDGYIIVDESADPYFPKNSIVFAAELTDIITPLEELHGHTVIVVREDSRGLFQTTIREVYITHRNEAYLSPVTEDPSLAVPYKVKTEFDTTANGGNDGILKLPQSAIVGVVVASFRIEHPQAFITTSDQ